MFHRKANQITNKEQLYVYFASTFIPMTRSSSAYITHEELQTQKEKLENLILEEYYNEDQANYLWELFTKSEDSRDVVLFAIDLMEGQYSEVPNTEEIEHFTHAAEVSISRLVLRSKLG